MADTRKRSLGLEKNNQCTEAQGVQPFRLTHMGNQAYQSIAEDKAKTLCEQWKDLVLFAIERIVSTDLGSIGDLLPQDLKQRAENAEVITDLYGVTCALEKKYARVSRTGTTPGVQDALGDMRAKMETLEPPGDILTKKIKNESVLSFNGYSSNNYQIRLMEAIKNNRRYPKELYECLKSDIAKEKDPQVKLRLLNVLKDIYNKNLSPTWSSMSSSHRQKRIEEVDKEIQKEEVEKKRQLIFQMKEKPNVKNEEKEETQKIKNIEQQQLQEIREGIQRLTSLMQVHDTQRRAQVAVRLFCQASIALAQQELISLAQDSVLPSSSVDDEQQKYEGDLLDIEIPEDFKAPVLEPEKMNLVPPLAIQSPLAHLFLAGLKEYQPEPGMPMPQPPEGNPYPQPPMENEVQEPQPPSEEEFSHSYLNLYQRFAESEITAAQIPVVQEENPEELRENFHTWAEREGKKEKRPLGMDLFQQPVREEELHDEEDKKLEERFEELRKPIMPIKSEADNQDKQPLAREKQKRQMIPRT